MVSLIGSFELMGKLGEMREQQLFPRELLLTHPSGQKHKLLGKAKVRGTCRCLEQSERRLPVGVLKQIITRLFP